MSWLNFCLIYGDPPPFLPKIEFWLTKAGSCGGKNVTYWIGCKTCKVKGVKAEYYGETSRTLWDRTEDHLSLLRRKSDQSTLLKHWEEAHGDMEEQPEYSFNLMGRHGSALERQLKEALAISRSEVDILMNTKTEFGHNYLVTVKTDYEKDGRKSEERRGRGREEKAAIGSSPERKRKRREDQDESSSLLEGRKREEEERKSPCMEKSSSSPGRKT